MQHRECVMKLLMVVAMERTRSAPRVARDLRNPPALEARLKPLMPQYQNETAIETMIEIVSDQIATAIEKRTEVTIERRMQTGRTGKVERERGKIGTARTEKDETGRRTRRIRTKKRRKKAGAADLGVQAGERQKIEREEIESAVRSGMKGASEIGSTKGKETGHGKGKGMIEDMIGVEHIGGETRVEAEALKGGDLREKRSVKKELRRKRKRKRRE